IVAEGAILNDDWHIVFAARQRQRLRLVVADHKQAGEPEIHLLAGMTMGTGAIPVGAGAVAYLELIAIALTGPDRTAREDVHDGRHVQAVPVDDAGFVEVVHEIDAYFLAAAHVQDRPEVAIGQRLHARRIAFEYTGLERPYARRRAWAQCNVLRRGRQFEREVR